ncbi:MAG: DUF6869 domain-containing protein [Pyrinomonadaceae bacterium]
MNRELVENWITYYLNRRKGFDNPSSAWEKVDEVIRRDRDKGWELVLELIDAAPDDFILATIAAGPLEDLLNDSPAVLADRVEIEARRSPKFRRCLTGVWGVPDSLRTRVEKYLSAVDNPL